MSSDNDNKGNEIVISKDRIRKFQNGGHQHVIPMHRHMIPAIYTPDGLDEGWTHLAPHWYDEDASYTETDEALGPVGTHSHGGTHHMQTMTSGPSGGRLNGNGGHNPMDTPLPLRRLERGETVGPLREGGRVKPVRRNMANGGVAKAKPTSRPGCCRGKGGRVASRPTSRSASRPAPLRGGGRSGGVR